MSDPICKYCSGTDEGTDAETCESAVIESGAPAWSMSMYCTRKPKHEGVHVACGISPGMHAMGIWPQAEVGSVVGVSGRDRDRFDGVIQVRP